MNIRFKSLVEVLAMWLAFEKTFRLCDWDGAEGIEYGLDKESGLQGIETSVWPRATREMLHAAQYRGEITDELLHTLCQVKYREGAGAWPNSASDICDEMRALSAGFAHPEHLEMEVLLQFVSEQSHQVIAEGAAKGIWQMTPGMFDFQTQLLAQGCKAAVCTSACRHGYLDSLLDHFGTAKHFQYLIGAEDCQRLGLGFKPNVDPFLHCLQQLEAPTDGSVLITEDNPKNLAAAVHGLRRAGYEHVFGLFIGRPGRDQLANEAFFRKALGEMKLEPAAEEISSRTALIKYDDLALLPKVLEHHLHHCQ